MFLRRIAFCSGLVATAYACTLPDIWWPIHLTLGQFWRIPAITLGIPLGRSVGIAIVVELLGNIPGTDLTDSLITVVGESFVTIYAHISEGEGMEPLPFLESEVAFSHL